MPIPGGFATAPTVSLLALTTPSPGVQVTVTATDAAAVNVTVWRSSASTGKVVVRGADLALISTSFTVDDFEAPIGEELTYSAATFDLTGTQSDESAGTAITLSSSGTWLSDPIQPASAVQVTIQAFPTVSKIVDAELFTPVGATAPIMISGVRSKGAGSLSLYTGTLDALNALRSVIDSAPVVLLRTSDPTWDMPPSFYGVQGVEERRIGTLSEPSRIMTLEITTVQRPVPGVAGPLHTWGEVLSKGLSWAAISAPDLTWLQLAQRGGL